VRDLPIEGGALVAYDRLRIRANPAALAGQLVRLCCRIIVHGNSGFSQKTEHVFTIRSNSSQAYENLARRTGLEGVKSRRCSEPGRGGHV
jgi:hypothetical protein